jgi:hypothetical protein
LNSTAASTPRARTLDRIADMGGVTTDWLLRGDRPVAIPPARDPAWGEAVAWLRQAWRDPRRRETVVGVQARPGLVARVVGAKGN